MAEEGFTDEDRVWTGIGIGCVVLLIIVALYVVVVSVVWFPLRFVSLRQLYAPVFEILCIKKKNIKQKHIRNGFLANPGKGTENRSGALLLLLWDLWLVEFVLFLFSLYLSVHVFVLFTCLFVCGFPIFYLDFLDS